ncbi:MAG: FAD-dependent oxidoreductase, partial [Solirubrobacterales bacterium]
IVDSYEQLHGGMHEVVAAAATRSYVRLQTEARSLLVEGGRVRGLLLEAPTGERATERFDGVVLATPAHAAARLIDGLAPRLAALLDEVRYFPVTVLLVEYERPVFDPNVRAIVFGADRPLSNAGAYGVNELNVVRYTFSGRPARSLTEDEPDPELLTRIAEDTLAPFAALAGNRRVAVVARRMSPGLCAYHSDQAALLRALTTPTAAVPGLTLSGDYLRGCSIEACFAAAEEAVAAIDSGELR